MLPNFEWLPSAGLLGICSFGIEIGIAIEIDPVSRRFFLHGIATLAKAAQHRRALQDRAAGNLEISSSISFSGLAISFRDIQRDRLTRPKPLASGMAMGSGEFFGMLEYPGHVGYGHAVNVQFFVSQGHEFFDFDSDPDFDLDFFFPTSKSTHPYQRGRASITGLRLKLRKSMKTGWLIGVAVSRLVELSRCAAVWERAYLGWWR